MKKLRIFTALSLVLCLLLCACGVDEAGFPFESSVESSSTSAPSTEQSSTVSDFTTSEVAETSVDTADSSEESLSQSADKLVVHYIDVGQGDSIFIELPDKTCMLIDAGDGKHGETVCSYIKALGYNKIDTLIATHPHADHIGGMIKVVEDFEIGKIYMTRAETTTKTFENLLTAISVKDMKINKASAGVSIIASDSLKADFIAPVFSDYDDLNDWSAVVMLQYGDTKFLFMGDASKSAEKEITANVECDVIKVGHHGSSDASDARFIKKTNASYAVVSLGKDNSYNHPHAQTIKTFESLQIPFLRTDQEGTIVFESDGNMVKRVKK